MPWSPVKYFPQILENLRDRGFKGSVTLEELEKEIIKEIGVIRPATIRNTIKAMEKLGYIKHQGRDRFLIVAGGENEEA